jgi:hypothetical protein
MNIEDVKHRVLSALRPDISLLKLEEARDDAMARSVFGPQTRAGIIKVTRSQKS